MSTRDVSMAAMRITRCAALVCVALLLWCGLAAAQAAEDARDTREQKRDVAKQHVLSVFGEGALGGPYGWLGGGMGLRPTWWLSLELGGGVTLGGGLQAGIGTGIHYKWPNADELGVLFALSRDEYSQSSRIFAAREYEKTWNTGWAYFGGQGRKHLGRRVFLRSAIGMTGPIFVGGFTCGPMDDYEACHDAEFHGQLSVFGSLGLEIALY